MSGLCDSCGAANPPNSWFCAQCAAPTKLGRQRLSDPASLDEAKREEPEGAHTAIDTPSAYLMSEGADTEGAIFETTQDSLPSNLDQYESFLLSMIDGKTSIDDIRSSGVLTSEELQASLAMLQARGLITQSQSEPSTPSSTFSWLLSELELDGDESMGAAPLDQQTAWLRSLEPPAPDEPMNEGQVPSWEGLQEQESSTSPGVVRRRLRVPRSKEDAANEEPKRNGLLEMSKVSMAQRLFKAAQRDRDLNAVVSARMNLKLACALDPDKVLYRDALDALGSQWKFGTPHREEGAEPAWSLHDQAVAAEKVGDLDGAVRFLKSAIQLRSHGAFYNRLGVLLATRMGEMKDGERMLKKAIELDPDNRVYVHNLAKVLSAMALDNPNQQRRHE